MKFILSVVCESLDEVRHSIEQLGGEPPVVLESKQNLVAPPEPAPKPSSPEPVAPTRQPSEQEMREEFGERYTQLVEKIGTNDARSVFKSIFQQFGAENPGTLDPKHYADFLEATRSACGA